jgi:hypothetical protein
MKIPKSFKLFGSTVTVEMNNAECDKEDAYGAARFKINVIYLRDNAHGESIDKTEIESTFLHEVIHFIFTKLGYDELSEDEKLVEQFSKALHQVLTTQEYIERTTCRGPDTKLLNDNLK